MRRNGRAVLVCAACVLCGPVAARASVADFLGKPITSVRLLLDGRDTAEPALLADRGDTRRRPVVDVEVRESVAHLFSLGRFEDVRVDASAEGGGVALRYELSPIHVISKIEFAGAFHAPGIDINELRRVLLDRFGTSPPLGRVDQLSLTIVDALG